MGQPRPLFHLFLFFQPHYKFYKKYVCEKCPSSIWCRDSNSRPWISGVGPLLMAQTRETDQDF